MIKADLKVAIDACVSANFAVSDLLLRLTERPRQLAPVWSEQILEEMYRTHVEKLGWGEGVASSFRSALRRALPDALCTGYEHLLDAMTNEENDRHVAAASIHGGASLILLVQTLGTIAQWRNAEGDTLDDLVIELGRSLPRLAVMLHDDLDLS